MDYAVLKDADELIETLRREHYPSAKYMDRCGGCSLCWPCSGRQAADMLEALKRLADAWGPSK